VPRKLGKYSQITPIQVAILKELRYHPLSAKELQRRLGVSLSTVYRYLGRLEEEFVKKEKKRYSLTVEGRMLLEILKELEPKPSTQELRRS